ncbi:SRPBCC family protein [Amycolatopsis antarctica]|uniref:SRPBCC family protein n=1 Tax=Amycolatopsis antarctica TaxID=1854586 RepID=UPI0013FD1A44|nr:SRPBCC family protein [Amycolatopsis antarctica]
MSIIETSTAVRASVADTFARFTDFESYPAFMRSVDQVTRDSAQQDRLRFVYSIGGIPRHYTIDVDSSEEFAEVHWTSVDGPQHTGLARVSAAGEGNSELYIKVDLRPAGIIDSMGDALGLIRSRVQHDMKRFAEYVESGGEAVPGPADADHRAPLERLFDRVFPTDQSR